MVVRHVLSELAQLPVTVLLLLIGFLSLVGGLVADFFLNRR